MEPVVVVAAVVAIVPIVVVVAVPAAEPRWQFVELRSEKVELA